MITFQASVSKGWLHQRGGFLFDEKYYTDPLYRRSQDLQMSHFINRSDAGFPLHNMEANLMQASYIHDDQVLAGGIQPNLILARILGAEFRYYPDKDMDVKDHPMKNISSVQELTPPGELLSHPYILGLDKQLQDIQRKFPDFNIIPPFFWDSSGRATIHGIITTSLKLLGDRAMMMIMMDPQLLQACHQWITDSYKVLIDHFIEYAIFEVTSIHIGECSGAMLSNEQYKEFVNPYINELGDEYSNIRLHSCGLSDHILDAMAELRNVHIIDTGSNTSISRIRELKGKDFEIHVEPPMHLLLEGVDMKLLLAWLDEVLEENMGGPLRFSFHIESAYSMENCRALYKTLVKRKLIDHPDY